jgi:hypothetical protein
LARAGVTLNGDPDDPEFIPLLGSAVGWKGGGLAFGKGEEEARDEKEKARKAATKSVAFSREVNELPSVKISDVYSFQTQPGEGEGGGGMNKTASGGQGGIKRAGSAGSRGVQGDEGAADDTFKPLAGGVGFKKGYLDAWEGPAGSKVRATLGIRV